MSASQPLTRAARYQREWQLASAFHQGYRQFRELPDLDDPHMLAFQIMNVVDLIVWILDWDARMPLATGPRRIAAALERLRRLVGYLET